MKRVLPLVVVWIVVAVSMRAQETRDWIDAAINAGLASKAKSHPQYRSNPGLPYFACVATAGITAREFYVTAVGPSGRVALAAFNAKLNRASFTRADITPDMTARVVTVKAELAERGADAVHVVITGGSKEPLQAIQPISQKPIPATFNHSGTAEVSNGIEAIFNIDALRDLRGPFMIEVRAAVGTPRKCQIPAAAMAILLGD